MSRVKKLLDKCRAVKGIKEVWTEDHGVDGADCYWAYCKEGWWNGEDAMSGFHEYTPQELLDKIKRAIGPDERPANER